jgi:hypothetical protein
MQSTELDNLNEKLRAKERDLLSRLSESQDREREADEQRQKLEFDH